MNLKIKKKIPTLGGLLLGIAAHGAPAPTSSNFDFFTPQPSVLQKAVVSAIPKQTEAWVDVYPGSLKLNVIRLARAYGWKHIIWLSEDDYHWIGKVRVAANNLPDILNKILVDYPLQANFYEGNHVLVITPRTIQA